MFVGWLSKENEQKTERQVKMKKLKKLKYINIFHGKRQ